LYTTTRWSKLLLLMAASASLLSMLGFAPASSRPWKATPITLAREYGQIIDTRGIGDIVIVSWMVPQGIPADSPGAVAMQAMLQHYVLMVTVHGQLDKTTGVVSFKDNEDFSVKDRNGKQLASVARESLPPTNIAMITGMEAVFRQSLGAMGSGMKTFLFNGEGIDSCKKGQLAVQFAGETYTWDTPFPGCDNKN
jgi:hypothetical protein